MTSAKTPQDVLSMCRQHDVKSVDLRFTDLMGTPRHLTFPVTRLTEELFEDGVGFDGFSLRAWQAVQESDMLLIPHPDTAYVDPFSQLPMLCMTSTVQDPLTGEAYSCDPRDVAVKASAYLTSTGIADTAYFGPQAEFFIFDDAGFETSGHNSFYRIDSTSSDRNPEARSIHSFSNPSPSGYESPTPFAADPMQNVLNAMVKTMVDVGLKVASYQREVDASGQSEVDLQYGEPARVGDSMMTLKYVVKNVARAHGKVATFMPKPILGAAGSGMHTHLSLWKNDQPLFAGGGYAGLSDMAIHAVGGILKHAPALMAFTNPTTNSYKRLVPEFAAPVDLVYSTLDRSAACRIPMYDHSPGSKRIEFRCPDPTCNPYLSIAALLMAVIDGIAHRIDPGAPYDDASGASPQDSPRTPESLARALNALESDHEFLLTGGVFSEQLISTWISYKREHDVAIDRSHPTPQEFCQYFDA